MDIELLQSIFLYFARYPSHNGVMKNFNRSSTRQEYVDFKQSAFDLPKKNLFPEIKDYVFGTTDKEVSDKIQSFSGTYMFIDYGNLEASLDRLQVKTETLKIGITIAMPLSSNTFDSAELILMHDRYLKILSQIREDVRNESKYPNPFVKQLTFPSQIIPYQSAELKNSFGWSMVYEMKGVGLI